MTIKEFVFSFVYNLLRSCFLSCLKNKLLTSFPMSGHNYYFFLLFPLILENFQAFMQHEVNLDVD